MAFQKRPKNPSFTTPKGTFKFPKLNEPDTKFKADGEYAVKVVFDHADPAVQALLDKIEPLQRKAIEKAETAFNALPVATRKGFAAKGAKGPVVAPLYKEIFDETTEEPTGEIEMNFKMAASGTFKTGPKAGQRWTRKPTIFDAKGSQMASPPAIWGGTVGKVAFEIGLDKDGEPGYFVPGTAMAGLSLRLSAAQIIQLVTSGGGRSASSLGFGQEEGYEYEEPSGTSTESENPGAGLSDNGDADF